MIWGVRQSSKCESLAGEEEEYREWLKGQKEDINNEETKKQLEPLKEYWSNPKLDDNEAFLKDFFLNKRYRKYLKTLFQTLSISTFNFKV